jgi:hypothetical protein
MAVLPTGIGPVTGYNIERSLRFNSADTAYLSETFGTPTNNRIWTWSGWVKRSVLGSAVFGHLFSHYTSSTANNYFYFNADTLYYQYDNGTVYALTTSAVFRDPSAWYHVVLLVDTTNATASERTKIYVNGIQQTVTGSYVPQNTLTYLNNSGRNVTIGRRSAAADQYFDGYMTEINFIDGQALTPSSFGETDASTGVWKPKKYDGTYGTNGFFLKFADNSGTTSTTLGKDSSGNGNNWTPNNFSVTAGVGNDSLVDSPTAYGTDTGVGGEVRGNYCTWNPLNKQSNLTLSNGNLDTSTPAIGTWRSVVGTVAMTSGKWYWEATAGANGGGNNYSMVGIASTSFNALIDNAYLGSTTDSWSYYGNNGTKYNNSSSVSYGASYTTNDVIGIAYDADNGTLAFYKNGVSQGTAFTGLSGAMVAGTSGYNGSGMYHNFGQRPFAYTAPSGFKALCTQNLPTPTIGATSTTQANDYFNTVLYTGNGSTQSITGVGFQPDWVWVKSRSSSGQHSLTDAVRGVNKQLFTNLTDAEGSQTDQVTAFNSDGFSLGANVAGTGSVNVNTVTYAAWNWNAGGSNATNTSGTITSTVRANTTSGFSIIQWSGSGANATIGHGLGTTPAFIIVKDKSSGTNGGAVYHTSRGATKYLKLFQTTTGSDAEATDNTAWNGSSPTFNSIVFSVGSLARTNASGTSNMIAYAFAEVPGYSAFGSYTGNGSADGPFVYTGFRPKYVLVKRTNTTGNWQVFDGARDTYNLVDLRLQPNLSNAEAAGTTSALYFADFLSNGFKIVGTDTDWNASSSTYIYAAFAEAPFKYSLAR